MYSQCLVMSLAVAAHDFAQSGIEGTLQDQMWQNCAHLQILRLQGGECKGQPAVLLQSIGTCHREG